METKKVYNKTDAEDFKKLISHLLPRLKILYNPHELAIIRIKNWFDHKWLNYSGKKIEKFDLKSEPGIPFVLKPYWNEKITVPPFNPQRVEARFDLVNEDAEESSFSKPFHTWQWTTENRNNFIADKTNNGLCIWISTQSLQNQRGSLMVYIIKNGTVETWYASVENHNGWKISRTKGIDKEKLLFMLGDQYLAGKMPQKSSEDLPTSNASFL